MRRAVQFGFVVALLGGWRPLALLAQESVATSGDTQTQQTVNNELTQAGSRDDPSSRSEDATSVSPQKEEPVYAGSLNGSGLIAMDESAEKHLLFSMTTGGGWDTNPGNMEKASSSGVYSLSPYLGYRMATQRSQLIVQYQPTFLGYNSEVYARQSLHRASGSMLFTQSERLTWKVDAFGNYGPNGTRLLSSSQAVAVGEVPGTSGASSASYLGNSSNLTYVAGSVSAAYRLSEQDTIAVTGTNAYSRTSDLNQQGGIANLQVAYTRAVSETVSWNGYAQGGHFYGDLAYETYGAGGGLRWRPRERTSLSVSVGPQFTTCDCASSRTGLTYSVSFGTRIADKWQMYALTDHLPTVSYLGPSLWQRSASSGVQYQVTRIGVVSADVGYISSDTLKAVSSYRGISWGVNYGFHLPHGLAVLYTYRGYATNTGGAETNRNLAQASITWTYRGGEVFQGR